MKRLLNIIYVAAAVCSLGFVSAGCTPEMEPLDSPFLYIKDADGGSSLNVDAEANNYTTSLYVSTVARRMEEPFTVTFRAIVGGGLKEGVDFRIKQGLEGTLTFQPGITRQPIHIVWSRNSSLDSAADNTLTIEIVSVSNPEFTIGYLSLGDENKYRTYTFTRVKSN